MIYATIRNEESVGHLVDVLQPYMPKLTQVVCRWWSKSSLYSSNFILLNATWDSAEFTSKRSAVGGVVPTGVYIVG